MLPSLFLMIFLIFNRGFQGVNIHQFNEKMAVKKLLAPMKPPAILCVGVELQNAC